MVAQPGERVGGRPGLQLGDGARDRAQCDGEQAEPDHKGAKRDGEHDRDHVALGPRQRRQGDARVGQADGPPALIADKRVLRHVRAAEDWVDARIGSAARDRGGGGSQDERADIAVSVHIADRGGNADVPPVGQRLEQRGGRAGQLLQLVHHGVIVVGDPPSERQFAVDEGRRAFLRDQVAQHDIGMGHRGLALGVHRPIDDLRDDDEERAGEEDQGQGRDGQDARHERNGRMGDRPYPLSHRCLFLHASGVIGRDMALRRVSAVACVQGRPYWSCPRGPSHGKGRALLEVGRFLHGGAVVSRPWAPS